MIDIYLHKEKPKPTTKKICNNEEITKEVLIQNFKPPIIDEKMGLNQAYNQLEVRLQKMLDKTAPEKTINVYDKPKQPYFNKYVHEQRKIVKNRERAWQKFKKDHQWLAYREERNRYNKLLQFQKKQSIIQKVMDNPKNTKGLFRLINKLTNNTKGNPLPNRPPEVLAEEFATYFLEKIRPIWEKFINIKPFHPETKEVPQFRSFIPLTSMQVYKTITMMKSKSCE